MLIWMKYRSLICRELFELGYSNVIGWWYNFEEEEFLSIQVIQSESGILKAIMSMKEKKKKVLNLYVEHVVELEGTSVLLLLTQGEQEPISQVVMTYMPGHNKKIEYDDPDFDGDDEDDEESDSLEYFVDSDEDEEEDIYDTERDLTLSRQVNNWMYTFTKSRFSQRIPEVDKYSDYASSNDLRSINGSDNSDSEPRRRNKELNPLTNTNLKVGQEFNDHKSFRKALKDWSINNEYDYNFKANVTRKVTIVCMVEDCPWRVHASKDREGKVFIVKTYAGSHTCGRQFRNNKVSARWVALKYIENFRDSPLWESNSLKQAVHREHMVFISDDKASWAKNIALKIILCDEKQQFANVRRFCVRHLHDNFKKVGYKGRTLKDLVWNAARAYTLAKHNRYMKESEKEEPKVFEWLKKLETR
ncbi:hypothetical protein Cni_G04095 [Canna indica]|uniref:Transposase MuDR plant domain-containing protein n=1 Tax=Canna indica TaxID=4628 RepID=A0AAQ3JS81_9LILI|nr:hypothetical protein Cni_G04095 [Canna indica]